MFLQKIKIFLLIHFLITFHQSIAQNCSTTEYERSAITLTDEDFQTLVKQREKGLAGFHLNVDSIPIIPAQENIVLNWAALDPVEKDLLSRKQEKMFRQGKITLLVLAGGEATRFGCPKPFISVTDDLGEFLEIKAANLNWVHKSYGTEVPLYILASEKRLHDFKKDLSKRHYYGMEPSVFQWFTQGTVDTFIPTDAELKANFNGDELKKYLIYTAALRQANPDGIYRFKGERRKIPAGHFDAIASFIISGLFSDALNLGIEFVSVVNIDNLQAVLKNDGMIAYFAERGDDIGFLLTEKNLYLTISDKEKNIILQHNLIVRFRDNVLSFDSLNEFIGEAVQDGYKYVINQETKTVDVFDITTDQFIETQIAIKSEIGGTLVQPANEKGEAIGVPIMKEGFEIPKNFDHARAPFFNTNTLILNLKGFLKFLNVSEKDLAEMNFDQRSVLVRENLIKQIKPNFEFKNHEVDGEYPDFGIVKNGKTKILVSQVTRIMLQAAHLNGAKIGYIFAPRNSVWTPVREPEDKNVAAKKSQESLKQFTLYPIPRS